MEPDAATVTRKLPEITDAPWTGAELRAALDRAHAESLAYWQTYPTPAFFAPLGTAWAPASHVRHLTRAMRAVTSGLRLPRLALRLAFGTAHGPSRRFDALRTDYRAALARGGQAGRFAPAPLAIESSGAEAARARIMGYHAAAVAALTEASARWPEESLDRYRLPHPLLGRITVREMLAFTVAHNVHHVHVAERRRRESLEAAERAP